MFQEILRLIARLRRAACAGGSEPGRVAQAPTTGTIEDTNATAAVGAISRLAPPKIKGGHGAESADAYRQVFLSTADVTRNQIRLTFAVVVISAIIFAAAAPFARVPLIPVPAFIPAYEAVLIISDLITALLLFGQFAQLRSAALLVLAGGYLFDLLMIIPHALTFPGLFSPTGLLGSGKQSTAWIYVFWHAGFPLFIIAYTFVRANFDNYFLKISIWKIIVFSFIGISLLTCGMAALAISGKNLLPVLLIGNNHYTAWQRIVISAVWLFNVIALGCLYRRRRSSVLDLWLAVVMFAWIFDVALSAVLNAGRFDLGFYAGRAYGLVAATFVLAGILLEVSGLPSRLAAAMAQLEDHARTLDDRVRERTAALRRTNRELSAIIAASPVAIYMLDHDGTVMLWTASAERVFGYTKEEVIGLLPPYLFEDYIDDFRANIARAVSGDLETGAREIHIRRKDDKILDMLVRWSRVHDEAGRILGIMCAATDITENKKLESHLRQAQKMEAIGNLTGGMAHDFNNLLGVIIGNLDLLRDRQTADAAPELDELAHEALDAALRGADLTRRLLAFARRQSLQPERVNINELIAGISKLLDRTLGEEIEITLELNTDIWPVVVDPAQLESSLINLATNARDAMPKGGHLIIATSNRRLDRDYASEIAEVQPGDYVLIEISDTGCGMPPEVANRIFEPFYTTKEPGKGTGLGLSMVFGFIKQSGGHLNVYSEVGIGTTFRLYLPRADGGAETTEAAMPQSFVRGRGETVLAVEDNASLRRIVVRQLKELGYRVLEAEDAHTALEMLENERVDLLFTDIVMPGGASGYELARMALSRWPGVKILLTSGFPDNKIYGNETSSNIRLLSKPYRRDDLGRIIREVLET
jgi:PAS domain S-box-containing protein